MKIGHGVKLDVNVDKSINKITIDSFVIAKDDKEIVVGKTYLTPIEASKMVLKLQQAISTILGNVSQPVIFNGRKFFGIDNFDCHSISLFTETTLKGTFFTAIPISTIEYRKRNPTKAKVEIETKEDWTIFKIYCDFGNCYKVEIHNSLSKEIEFAKQQAVYNGLI